MADILSLAFLIVNSMQWYVRGEGEEGDRQGRERGDEREQ
jgi:hypothetical protein